MYFGNHCKSVLDLLRENNFKKILYKKPDWKSFYFIVDEVVFNDSIDDETCWAIGHSNYVDTPEVLSCVCSDSYELISVLDEDVIIHIGNSSEVRDSLRIRRKSQLKNSKPKPDFVDLFCPLCGSRLIKRTSKYGPFIGCSAYPKCKYIHKDKQ